MSSVTRFIRQIQPETSLFSAAVVCASPATHAYEFVPAAGNVVGNYPAGTMTSANGALATAILAQVAGAGGIANVVLRDMGKTIRTNITGTSTVGFFRQVQLLLPQPITNSQGFIGGASGNLFGVQGGAASVYAAYLTFYVPVVVGGVLASPASLALQSGVLGGAM
jgi:hypothetical protein